MPPFMTIQSGIPVARIELARRAAGAGVQSAIPISGCRRRRCCSLSFTAREASVAEQSQRFR